MIEVEKAQKEVSARQEQIGELIENMEELATALAVSASMSRETSPKHVHELIGKIIEFVSSGGEVVEAMESLVNEGADIVLYQDGPPEEAEDMWLDSWLRKAARVLNGQG